MTTVATTRTWLRRMAAAAPTAWHYDRVFRWSAIGAGIALVLLVLRLGESPAQRMQISVPGSSAIPGPTSDASSAGSLLAPPISTALPKIAPGRSLDGVTITPAPEHDRFGTLPVTTHK